MIFFKNIKFIISFILISGFIFPIYFASAQVMSSSKYKIQSDSMNFGGARSSSGSYIIEDTVGEIATGDSSGNTHKVRAGYQQIDSVVVLQTGSRDHGESKSSQRVVPNVKDFKATARENNIMLTWKIPEDSNIDSVVIIKSDKFFPGDINDGEIIFEGNAENFIDYDVEVGKRYYYAIFAKNSLGNYSSGALATARIIREGEIVIATSTDIFANISILENVHPDIKKLSLLDFDFIQDGRKLSNIGDTIVIDGSKNLTISLRYNKVPEILKTIAITLIDPDDPTQIFPFLLRVNEDKTAYEATIAPLGKSGKYGLSIMILDYKNQGLKRLTGSLKALVFDSVQDLFGNKIVLDKNFLLLSFIMLTILVLFVKIHQNKMKEKDNEIQ
ncbi:MAG: hypothetical protein AAB637_01635 [Patescibacteria group bacterium]